MSDTTAARVEAIKERTRQHQDKLSQLKGRLDTTSEQLSGYVAKLAEAGLTPEDLPDKIGQLNQSLETVLTEYEAVLDAAGA